MERKEIEKIISNSDYDVYGLRKDDRLCSVGEILPNSHQLYQDPQYTDDSFTELLYPLVTEGIYKGFYDAGELDGACAVFVDEYSVESSLDRVETYGGKYLYLIAGNRAWEGKDLGEIIIENPEVIMVIKKKRKKVAAII